MSMGDDAEDRTKKLDTEKTGRERERWNEGKREGSQTDWDSTDDEDERHREMICSGWKDVKEEEDERRRKWGDTEERERERDTESCSREREYSSENTLIWEEGTKKLKAE